MKKQRYIVIFFSLTLINTVGAGFWILNLEQKTEILAQRIESTKNLEKSLYDSFSLEEVISKLNGEIADRKISYRSIDEEYDSLKMTEDVLLVFQKNRMKIIYYKLEGKEKREELALAAEGSIGNILKLIYDLSFSKDWFRIIFINVDTILPGKPATLVLRVTYA